MTLKPSQVRKYTRFPKGGSVLGGFDVKEATLDIDNGTWFVMFDGKVSRRQARNAMAHFINRVTNVPTNERSFSTPKVIPIELKCDEVTTVMSNPSGRVTIAKGHLSFDGVLKNPTSVAEFKKEMNDMVTHNPHKVFRDFTYNKLNDKEFLDKLWSFVSYSGESYGWVTNNGRIFHRRASLIMPKIKINKRPDNEVAFYHTHPSKDEPSLTSADDIQFYADLSFAPGVKRHYTVMRDRIDYFQFNVKNPKMDEYLKIDEDHFVQDIDAMIEEGEKKYTGKKDLDAVEFCRLVTQHMVDKINEKYKGLMNITYKHFVNPEYKGDEDPLFNPLPNPLPNPTNPKIPSKYHHHSLTDLQGVDYSWVHYGGDEFAHTLYTYYWMRYYFEPNQQGVSRMYMMEDIGFDSDLRKKVRAYLNRPITGNWTYLDLLFVVGLYHDIGKVREKETGEHHSIAGKYMWDEFIADELDVPAAFEDIVSTMFESDIGRRNITDEFFQTIIGDYYGVALLMQMTDIATHHPTMSVHYAKLARQSGTFKGDVNAFKKWSMAKKVERLRAFLDQPMSNPRPKATQIKWVADYGVEGMSQRLVEEILDPYKGDNESVYRFGRQHASPQAYFYLNSDNFPEIRGMIPDDVTIAGRLIPKTSVIWLHIGETHRQDDFGEKLAQTIYEALGEILKGIEPRVKIDKVETGISMNPRKAKKVDVILVSGPPGTGKSTFIRYLKKNFPVVGEPLTVTSRPPRPKEKDGVDRIFTTKAEFEKMIEADQFVEWKKQKNGHYYGRRWVDFKFPVNVVDLNLKGIRSYQEAFPNAYSIFLAPDIPPKSMVKRIMRRGGVGIAEARRRANLGPVMVANAKKMNWDQFVTVKSGSYNQVFADITAKMNSVFDNPRVHESMVMISITPELRPQQTLDGRILPFNERERQYMRERQRNIDFNRTASGADYVSFIVPEYFTDEQLPSGSIRSPVNRKNVLVPSPDAPAFETFLSKAELPMGNPEGIRLSDVMLSADYQALLQDIASLFRGGVGANWNAANASEHQKKTVAKRKKAFKKRMSDWGYTGTSPANAAQHIFKEHLKKFRNGQLKVYRAMFTTESNETLDGLWDRYGVGVFWSDQRQGADQFGGASAKAFKFHPSSRVAFLIGKVPFGDVDWTFTLYANIRFGVAESEVRMFNDSRIKVERVEFYRLSQKAREKYLGQQGPGGRYSKPWTDPSQKPVAVWEPRKTYSAFKEPKNEQDEEISNPKELFDWFEEWVHLINMKNKELEAFLDSPLGKQAGLSKQQAKDWNNIKSGRVSGRRILKMRAKLGLTGPKDYIKAGPRIIEDYYEKALNSWTGPSDDPLKGETDWDWCKRQVRFVKRTSAFPYNPNAEERKGPLVRVQKTQAKPSRRLLSLWVWGHDPWRWARKNGYERMSPCPDVPWVGMTEKRKYGKIEVKQNPPDPYAIANPPKRIKPNELAKLAVKSITKKNFINAGYFGSVFYIPGTKFVFKVERLADPEYYAELSDWLQGKGKKPKFPADQRRVFKYNWDFDAEDFAFPLYAIGDGKSGRYHTIMEFLGSVPLDALTPMRDHKNRWKPRYQMKQTLEYMKQLGGMHQSVFDRFARNFAAAKDLNLQPDFNLPNFLIALDGKRISLIDWFWEYGPSEYELEDTIRAYGVETLTGASSLNYMKRVLHRSRVQWLMKTPAERKKMAEKRNANWRVTWPQWEEAMADYAQAYDLFKKVFPKMLKALKKNGLIIEGRSLFPQEELDERGRMPYEEWVLNELLPPPPNMMTAKFWKEKMKERKKGLLEGGGGFRDDQLFDWGLQEVVANAPDGDGPKGFNWPPPGGLRFGQELVHLASGKRYKYVETQVREVTLRGEKVLRTIHKLENVKTGKRGFITDEGLRERYTTVIHPDFMVNPPNKITPSYVRSQPDTLFVFGDNDQRRGTGGQAKIRNEPNTIGFRTKKAPRTNASAYYTDSEYKENISKMKEDLEEISRRSADYDSVYFIPGIGEGRAKLKEKAPKTYAWMKENLPQPNPWFPSDTSYPSALTDQTISITQLSNPRTPGGKKVPTRYLKGLTELERMIAEDEIDKGYEYDVDDPEAYEFWKSDIKAKARGLKIGSSKHKEEYYRRYRDNIDEDYKPSGSTPKQKFLNRIRKETGIKKSILEKTYDKGLAAWRTGHRPGVQQHQWAAGRVYALAVGADSSTGPGKPDHSLAVEAGVR